MTAWPLIPLSAFFVFGRIFSYFKSSLPLGPYDAGLYLYLFKKYAQIPLASFTSLPDWLVKMYSPGIPVLGKLASFFVAPEKIIVPMVIFFFLLLFFSVYLLAKKLWGQKAALWTVFIFACSAPQYRAYWYYYLKNIAGLSFLLFTFYFLPSGSYLAIPFSILVFYFHRPTAALLLITLLTNLIIQKKQRKYYGLVLASTLTAAALYYLPTFNQTVFPLIQPAFKSFLPQSLGGSLGMASGTFYDLKKGFLLSLPYLFPGIYGFWLTARQKKNFVITIPFVACLVIVVFRLFFSRRFIPFLDLFLIFFAGYGVAEFTKKLKKGRKKLFLIIYPLFLVTFISCFVYKTGKPLILEDELREIKMLSQTEEDAYVLATDEAYVTWIYGWSDRKTIAPKFGEYDLYWTLDEWYQFWASGDRKVEHDLLLKLPKPLYIYVGDRQPRHKFDFSGECFEKVNWRTYKFVCED